MNYSVKIKDRKMTAEPTQGRSINILSDLVKFINIGRNYGCKSLDFLGMHVDITEHNNIVKINEVDDFEVETFPGEVYPIRKIVTPSLKSINIKIVDGLELAYKLEAHEIQSLVNELGFIVLSKLIDSTEKELRYYCKIFREENYVIVASKNIKKFEYQGKVYEVN